MTLYKSASVSPTEYVPSVRSGPRPPSAWIPWHRAQLPRKAMRPSSAARGSFANGFFRTGCPAHTAAATNHNTPMILIAAHDTTLRRCRKAPVSPPAKPRAMLAPLLSQMNAVLLVFVAVHFENVGVGQKAVRDLDGKRFGVCLRIVKGHFDLHMSEIGAAEALGHVQGFAMWVAHHIESGLVVEAGGFDHKGVALPMPNRVT